jgi:hypothetical protein
MCCALGMALGYGGISRVSRVRPGRVRQEGGGGHAFIHRFGCTGSTPRARCSEEQEYLSLSMLAFR